jgi:dipeptidyl aminopeptidase/acylaminoacyl peptidase
MTVANPMRASPWFARYALITLSAWVLTAVARPFAVEDVIGVRHVYVDDSTLFHSDPPLNYSPDGRHAVIVTEHGDLQSGMAVWNMWLFSRDDVERLFQGSETSQAGRIIASFSTISNRPGIEKVRWLEDSRSISFIGRAASAAGQVFVARIDGDDARRRTVSKTDVLEYSISKDTLLYSVERKTDPRSVRALALFGAVVENESLMEISSPETANWDWLPDFETFVVRQGRTPMRINENPLRAESTGLQFWVSPDGRYAITRRRPKDIPAEWEDYQSPLGESFMYKRAAVVNRHGFDAEFVLLDLIQGSTMPIFRAPVGRRLGYFPAVAPVVAWSADGRRAIIASSFLPLTPGLDSAERSLRSHMPAASVIDVLGDGSTFTVLRYFPFDPKKADYVTRALWRDSRTACLAISKDADRSERDGKERLSCFVETNGRWDERPAEETTRASSISAWPVEIREDRNTPGQLRTASSNVTGASMLVRDFNEQLHGVERGAWETFEWTDGHGKRWEAALLLPRTRVEGNRIPLVIQTHGLPKNRFLADGSFSSAFVAQPLAAAGIAVLQIPDPDIDVMEGPDEGPRMLDAYETAVAALAEKKGIDSGKVGLIGFSRTCYHVEYALAFSTRVKFAAATVADGVDMGHWQYLVFGNGFDPLWSKTFEIKNGGPPFGTSQLMKWIDRAPGFNASRIATPLRLESYGRENVVLMWDMFLSLKMQGKPTELVYIEAAAHELVKPWQRRFSLQGNLDWFRFWLLGQEDGLEGKRAQYDRWRKLKAQRSTS